MLNMCCSRQQVQAEEMISLYTGRCTPVAVHRSLSKAGNPAPSLFFLPDRLSRQIGHDKPTLNTDQATTVVTDDGTSDQASMNLQ